MPTNALMLKKLLDHCRADISGKDALLNCCQDLQTEYKFETVFISAGQSPEDSPKAIVWLGAEELVVKSLWRIGVEDRVALTQTAYKVVQDVTGPPSFNPHGSLRIQKLASGVFFAQFTPGRGYLMVGCVHKEARPYPLRLSDELAQVWKEWKEPLWDVVAVVLRQQQMEAKKNEDNAQIKEDIIKTKSLGDKPTSPPLNLPENPNLPKRGISMVDEATHLYNRAYFEESLSIEVERAKRYKRNVTLILLSITPHSKPTMLEEAILARQAAETLVKSLRRIDILCRIDTYRFALLLPDTPHQNGTTIARRVFKFFKATMGESPIAHLNLSAAEFPLHAQDAKSLLEKADEFMNKAVLAGPNKAVLSD
jgi:diguanylate cyclase (GGDEF)-like protein